MDFGSLVSCVATIFLLLATGFFLRKIKLIDDAFSKKLSALIVKVGQPFMIINALIKCEYSKENLKTGFLLLALSFAVHAGMALYAYFAVIGYKDLDERKISEFSLVFANIGFIGIPISESLFGPIGGFYCAFFNVGFLVFLWTWGVAILSRKRSDIKIKLKNVFINFGTVPCAIGIALFASTLPMPAFLVNFSGYLGSLCTPISLLITGSLMAQSTPRELFANPKVYYSTLHKLLILPTVVAVILTLVGLDETMVVFGTLMAAMPSASSVSMFCEMYSIKPKFSATLVGVTSLLSVVTIPLCVKFAQFFVGWVR